MLGTWSNLWDRIELRFFLLAQLTCYSLVIRPGVECVPLPSTLPKILEAPDLCGEFARYKKIPVFFAHACTLGHFPPIFLEEISNHLFLKVYFVTVTKISQVWTHTKNQERTKIGTFFNFLLHFLTFLLEILKILVLYWDIFVTVINKFCRSSI